MRHSVASRGQTEAQSTTVISCGKRYRRDRVGGMTAPSTASTPPIGKLREPKSLSLKIRIEFL